MVSKFDIIFVKLLKLPSLESHVLSFPPYKPSSSDTVFVRRPLLGNYVIILIKAVNALEA